MNCNNVNIYIYFATIVIILVAEFFIGKTSKIKQSSTVEIGITIVLIIFGIIRNLKRKKENEST